MLKKEEALKKIKSLVERFDEQNEFYKKSEYNETQTRRDLTICCQKHKCLFGKTTNSEMGK